MATVTVSCGEGWMGKREWQRTNCATNSYGQNGGCKEPPFLFFGGHPYRSLLDVVPMHPRVALLPVARLEEQILFSLAFDQRNARRHLSLIRFAVLSGAQKSFHFIRSH